VPIRSTKEFACYVLEFYWFPLAGGLQFQQAQLEWEFEPSHPKIHD
jgi:hypothetical protein